MSTTPQQASRTFERHGSGVPTVSLPGLTFDRRSRRPIVDCLRERVCTTARLQALVGFRDTARS